MFRQRAIKINDKISPFKIIPSIEELGQYHNSMIINSNDERLLLDNHFYLSGEIPRLTAYEKGYPEHVSQLPNGEWEADPFIKDSTAISTT